MTHDVLLQQGRPEYRALLDLTEERHRAYAERHGLCYERFDGTYTSLTGHWDSIVLMRDILANGEVDWLFWLDADALAIGDTDPRTAVETSIGMVRHPGPPEHWNCGVLFLRNGRDVRRWLDEVWARRPGVYPWYQQREMNELLQEPRWGGLVSRLDDRWNSTWEVNESPTPEIVAWHNGRSPGEKLAAMRSYLERCG